LSSLDSDEPISEGKEICDSEMGGRYSPQSSSDGESANSLQYFIIIDI